MSLSKIKIFIPLMGIIAISCGRNKQQDQQEKAPEPAATSQQTTGLKYEAGNKQIPIWPVSVPDSGLIKGTEHYNDEMVRNVSNPTIIVFPARGKNTGVAALVFPGGGYNKLAPVLEGSEICEWLSSIGITGVLLKYRVPGSGPHYDETCHCGKDPVKPMALQDAQRAMGLVRSHAKEWNIDPAKVGVIGFSAGGHLVADISTHYDKRAYPLQDEADKFSCRPDFVMAIYPGHMMEHTTREYQLNPTIPINSHTPPTFLVQAGNDPVDTIQNSLVYYIALKKAGVHAEYHVYAEGGHAFGLRKTTFPITGWPKLAETWLHTIKMLAD